MYEQFYGLSRRPFQLMPDARFLYPSQSHRRALSYLLYGLEQREGFVVITGDIGTGKTLLIQTLFAELSDRPIATGRLAAANLDAAGVLPMVCAAFGRPHQESSKAALLQDLETTLLDDPAYRDGALLVVDEAQTFSPEALEELRILSNLESNGRALLQLFLVGQTDLRQVLSHPSMEQLRQRIIASHHLQPLSLDEACDYIFHRLRAAGWQEDPALTAALCESVFEWSGGVPRRVNLAMDRLLLYGYLEEKHELDESDLQQVVQEMESEVHAVQPQALPAADGLREAEQAALLRQNEWQERAERLERRVESLEKGFRALLADHARRVRERRKPEAAATGAEEGKPASSETVSRVAGRIAALDRVLEESLPPDELDAGYAVSNDNGGSLG